MFLSNYFPPKDTVLADRVSEITGVLKTFTCM